MRTKEQMIYPGHERRRFGRRQVFKAAVIVLPDATRLPAIVVDISEGGARVQTEHVALVGPGFLLEIPEDDLAYDCRLAHRQAGSVGVEFTRVPRRLSWLRAREATFRNVGLMDPPGRSTGT